MGKIWITRGELRTMVRKLCEGPLQLCEKCGMPAGTCECSMHESEAGEGGGVPGAPVDEVAPPGREKQVKGIKRHMKKGDIPKTYTDSSGRRKKSNPWALAWAQHNKE